MNRIIPTWMGLVLLATSARSLPAETPTAPPPLPEYRVLIIGDSITRHAPKESIQWSNHHGMAASAPEKDYVHLVLAEVGAALPGKTIKEWVPDKAGWVQGALSQVREYAAFRPELVIVQLGEHEAQKDRLLQLEKNYQALLGALSSLPSKPIVICTGVWNPQPPANGPYGGDTAHIEATMHKVAAGAGLAFVSVEDLARDPSCFGFGTARGVQWHPNDKGMQGYATRIATAWQKARSVARPGTHPENPTNTAPGI